MDDGAKAAQSPATLCPICGRPGAADYRPFCSKRCADVDLGRWMSGRYAIPTEEPGEGGEPSS